MPEILSSYEEKIDRFNALSEGTIIILTDDLYGHNGIDWPKGTEAIVVHGHLNGANRLYTISSFRNADTIISTGYRIKS